MSLDQSQYSLNFWLNVRSRLFDKHLVTLLSAFDIMASAEATHWSKCKAQICMPIYFGLVTMFSTLA